MKSLPFSLLLNSLERSATSVPTPPIKSLFSCHGYTSKGNGRYQFYAKKLTTAFINNSTTSHSYLCSTNEVRKDLPNFAIGDIFIRLPKQPTTSPSVYCPIKSLLISTTKSRPTLYPWWPRLKVRWSAIPSSCPKYTPEEDGDRPRPSISDNAFSILDCNNCVIIVVIVVVAH